MPELLIIGGSGFIGSNLSAELLGAGYTIYNFDRPGTCPEMLKRNPAYNFIPGDFSKTEELSALLENHSFECVIHLVCTLLPGSGYDDFILGQEINLNAGYRLIKKMCETGNNRILFFSSGGAVYGNNGLKINDENSITNPINFYGYSKLIFEEFLRLYNFNNSLDYIIVRPSNPYGERAEAERETGIDRNSNGQSTTGPDA